MPSPSRILAGTFPQQYWPLLNGSKPTYIHKTSSVRPRQFPGFWKGFSLQDRCKCSLDDFYHNYILHIALLRQEGSIKPCLIAFVPEQGFSRLLSALYRNRCTPSHSQPHSPPHRITEICTWQLSTTFWAMIWASIKPLFLQD